METLAHTLNYDNRYATKLHLQSTGSDKDWEEQSKILLSLPTEMLISFRNNLTLRNND